MTFAPKVELRTGSGGYGDTFDDAYGSYTGGWENLSSDVRFPMTVTRSGRQRDIDEFSAGSASVKLSNRSGRYDPSNSASDLYGETKPMRQMRLSATIGGVDYPLTRGFVEDWPVDTKGAQIDSVAKIKLVDALAVLAGQAVDAIDPAAHGGELSGARVSRILDLPEVSFPVDLRDIDAGRSTLGPTTFGENALSLLQDVARSELGALFAAADGTLTFRQRWPNRPSGQTFADDGTGIPFRHAPQDYSRRQIYNRITGSGTSGTVLFEEDVASQGEYQVRSLNRDLVLQDDGEVLAQLDWLLGRFAEPEQRFQLVVVVMGGLTETQQVQMVGLELGDQVTVVRTPMAGDVVTQLAVVDSIEWTWAGHNDLLCTVGVSAGTRLIPFTLDDPIAGVLDSEHRLGY